MLNVGIFKEIKQHKDEREGFSVVSCHQLFQKAMPIEWRIENGECGEIKEINRLLVCKLFQKAMPLIPKRRYIVIIMFSIPVNLLTFQL